MVQLLDATGETVASYEYDPWGNLLSKEPTDPRIQGQPIRYAGYMYDIETKLYYLMARYYNPSTGSFISLDPVRGILDEPLTLNRYSYVSNNPANFYVPTGTSRKPSLQQTGGSSPLAGSFRMSGVSGGGGSASKLTKGAVKLSKRDTLLNSVSNTNLKNAIKEMYRPGASVGDGSLAAAIRVETRYGTLVGGKSHLKKGRERIRQLEKLMGSGKLNQKDLKVANQLTVELKRALNGK